MIVCSILSCIDSDSLFGPILKSITIARQPKSTNRIVGSGSGYFARIGSTIVLPVAILRFSSRDTSTTFGFVLVS